jgi:hypothetical protein
MLCSWTKPEQVLRHWELYLGFKTVGNVYAKTDEAPTHAYLLLKLTMNWTHWNTFYTWCMQYQYDTPFLIIVQHSVKVNVDVRLTVFQLFYSRLMCIFKPAQAMCRTIWILNDLWQWTRTPSILLCTQNMWHMSWVWVAGPLVVTSKCIKVCAIIHNLYFVLWNSNTHTCNHELQSSKKAKAC